MSDLLVRVGRYYLTAGLGSKCPPSLLRDSDLDESDAPEAYSLASDHPGGANVVLSDGSVRFLKDSVALGPFWALDSRNGGEIISLS
jgi:prepilin-type processing-associated H-X9-DG protein